MAHRHQRTESVASLAGALVGRLDATGTGREQARVVAVWQEVAGADVFSHARGFVLRDGELLVFVDVAVWANELAALSEIYRTRINERIGKELVTSIRFTVSRQVEVERRADSDEEAVAAAYDEDRVPPVPLTEEEREAVEAMAAVITDDALRESATAAAIAHFEWRKGIEARKTAQSAVQRATDGSKPS